MTRCAVDNGTTYPEQRRGSHLLTASLHTSYAPLRNLHWLPVEKRIVYKLCVLMFDVKYGSAPAYLAVLCNVCTDEQLRSRSRGDFVIQRTRTRTADSAFMVAALVPGMRFRLSSGQLFQRLSSITA